MDTNKRPIKRKKRVNNIIKKDKKTVFSDDSSSSGTIEGEEMVCESSVSSKVFNGVPEESLFGHSHLAKKMRQGKAKHLEKLSDAALIDLMRIVSSDEDSSGEDSDEDMVNDFSPIPSTSGVVPTVSTAPLETTSKTKEEPSENPKPAKKRGPVLARDPIWLDRRPNRPLIEFSKVPKLNVLPASQTPRGYFDLVMNDKFYDLVVEHTELFAKELFVANKADRARILTWKTLTKDEFQIWLGLMFHMGHIPLSRFDSYWRIDPLYNIPIFRSKMSRDRFLGILQALYFAKNPQEGDPNKSDSIYSIRPLLKFFHETMNELVYPGKNLSLDEYHYRKNDRKYGVKMYMLTEPSGLVLRMLLYVGDKDNYEDHAEKVVHQLMEDFKDAGHSLFMDSHYNSYKLSFDLLKKGIYVTGPLRPYLKYNCTEVVNFDLKKDEIIYRWSADGICILKWKGRTDELMISTEYGPKIMETSDQRGKPKPEAVIQYNKYMGGIDHFDRLMSYYTCEHRTLKWYAKLGIHIFQTLLLNSFLLFQKYSGQTTTLFDFRHEIILSLLGETLRPSRAPVPQPVPNHFPRLTRYSEHGTTKHRLQKRCRVCAQIGARKLVIYFCPGCSDEPGLCLEPCFQKYRHG